MRNTTRLLAAAACGAVLLASPVVAHAQFGGLAKKALEKAVEKKVEPKTTTPENGRRGAADSPACREVAFDRTTVELTPERLDKVLKALQAVDASPAGAKRRDLVSQRDAAEARLQELENDEGIRRAQDSEREYRSCRNESFNDIVSARMEKEGAGLSAKYMQAMREHQDKVSAAFRRGDSAGAVALQDSLYVVLSNIVAPTAADSAVVTKKCGKEPRPSRRVAERDSLRVAVRELNDEIRAADEDSEDAMLKASGMTATQLAMARERLTMFVRAGKTCGFTKVEADAIGARKAELEKLL